MKSPPDFSAYRLALLLAVATGLTGCLTSSDVDRSVDREMDVRARGETTTIQNTMVDARSSMDTNAAPAAVALDLDEALRLSTRYGRALQTRREQLYLSGMDVLSAQRLFEPQLAGTLGYVLSRGSDSTGNHNQGALAATATQVLPSGATLTAGAQSSAATPLSTTNVVRTTYGNTLSVGISQPLLAGAGYEASHDPWIQANHELRYALRTFALDRQEFALKVARSYYSLLIQQAVVTNTRRNMDSAVYLRRRSEALFRVRKAPAEDVMRSQQQELSTSNQLAGVEAALDVSAHRFLLDLGLPPETRVTVAGSIPGLHPLLLDPEQCVVLALENRVDLKTLHDRVSDAERRVRIARNAMLPDVAVNINASTEAAAADSPTDIHDSDAYSVGATLDIPFDLRDERDKLKRARIALTVARRAEAEKKDTIKTEIADGLRLLKVLEASAGIELRNRDLAARRATYAEIQFKNGLLSNRDVVEAQGTLLQAGNAYVQALSDYENQRLSVIKAVGLLDVRPEGTLVERWPTPAVKP